MAGKAARGRRGASEWQEIVERFRKSGLSRGAFCRREGLAIPTLDQWTRRLGSKRAAAGFVELTPAASDRRLWELEVELPTGVTLRFRG